MITFPILSLVTFLPLVEAIASRVKTVRHFVALIDKDQMPASTSIPNLLCYEDLIDAEDGNYTWPSFDENAAASVERPHERADPETESDQLRQRQPEQDTSAGKPGELHRDEVTGALHVVILRHDRSLLAVWPGPRGARRCGV